MVSSYLVEGAGEVFAHMLNSQKESRPALTVQQLCAVSNFVCLASAAAREDDNTRSSNKIGPRHLPTPAKRPGQIYLIALRTSRRAQVESTVKFNVEVAQECTSISLSTPKLHYWERRGVAFRVRESSIRHY